LSNTIAELAAVNKKRIIEMPSYFTMKVRYKKV
jgi:hypothetical protein